MKEMRDQKPATKAATFVRKKIIKIVKVKKKASTKQPMDSRFRVE